MTKENSSKESQKTIQKGSLLGLFNKTASVLTFLFLLFGTASTVTFFLMKELDQRPTADETRKISHEVVKEFKESINDSLHSIEKKIVQILQIIRLKVDPGAVLFGLRDSLKAKEKENKALYAQVEMDRAKLEEIAETLVKMDIEVFAGDALLEISKLFYDVTTKLHNIRAYSLVAQLANKYINIYEREQRLSPRNQEEIDRLDQMKIYLQTAKGR